MARRYQPDELLRLRASPLVCKPDDLPIAEDWMGPPPEQNKLVRTSGAAAQKTVTNRAKTDDPSKHHDISARKTSFFETRHASRVSSTAPEDIVLGPPKTSFASASASRTSSQPLDPPDRSTSSNNGVESSRSERYNFREKFFRDREKSDIEADRQREQRSVIAQNRRGGKEEGDSWTSVRPRQSFGQGEDNRGTRRNGDEDSNMDRDLVRDARDRPQKEHDIPQPDSERAVEGDYVQRRRGLGRSRNEPTWFKDEELPNGKESRISKDNTRGRDWRDKDRVSLHVGNRDWTRGGKVEQDPEWMSSPEREENKQSHTQEDFERWKERMKASTAPAEDKPNHIAEPHINRHGSTSEVSQVQPVLKVDTPLVMDAGLDKFFGLWDESNPDTGAGFGATARGNVRKENGKNNVPKPSRFVGFFNPPPEPPSRQSEPSPPSSLPPSLSHDSSNEDKEGFQRILQMLGGANPSSGKAFPEINTSQQPELPDTKDQQPGLSMPDRPPSSGRGSEQQATTQIINSSESRGSTGLESLLGPQSPRDGPPQNRDSEFLLKLMQQSRAGTVSAQTQHHSQRTVPGNAPGLLPFPELISRPQESPKHKRPSGPLSGLFDDSLINDMQRGEQGSTRELPRRKATGGHQILFDDLSTAAFPRRQPQNTIQKGAPPALGLSRPPGLDQLPSGWPSQHSASQQQGYIAPPPGFHHTYRGPNAFPPGLMPNLTNTSSSSDRGPYGRPGGPGQITQGMPPPGFMGMNGPPPGFPPLPFNPDGMAGLPGPNHYGLLQRPQLELYGDAGNLGPSGRGAPQGQYKR
ncbi:MAG: hypothetical protein M1830_009132 [Pleopsidium flavum]|nr:MAG: hypothetical protein M1830_009132 [Pleopsidium flavum]